MEDNSVAIDVSGEMDVPPTGSGRSSKLPFDLNNIPGLKLEGIPSPWEIIQNTRKSVRPWTEFCNTANFKVPVSMPRLTSRFLRNLAHFQSNYIFVFIVLMIYCLVTSPLILLLIAVVLFASYKIRSSESAVTVFGHELSPKKQIIVLHICSVPILFLAGAGAVLFWTLGASCFAIFLHAAFYNIDAIVTEDTDNFLTEVV